MQNFYVGRYQPACCKHAATHPDMLCSALSLSRPGGIPCRHAFPGQTQPPQQDKNHTLLPSSPSFYTVQHSTPHLFRASQCNCPFIAVMVTTTVLPAYLGGSRTTVVQYLPFQERSLLAGYFTPQDFCQDREPNSRDANESIFLTGATLMPPPNYLHQLWPPLAATTQQVSNGHMRTTHLSDFHFISMLLS